MEETERVVSLVIDERNTQFDVIDRRQWHKLRPLHSGRFHSKMVESQIHAINFSSRKLPEVRRRIRPCGVDSGGHPSSVLRATCISSERHQADENGMARFLSADWEQQLSNWPASGRKINSRTPFSSGGKIKGRPAPFHRLQLFTAVIDHPESNRPRLIRSMTADSRLFALAPFFKFWKKRWSALFGRSFAVQVLISTSWTQKMFCRAFKELSNDVWFH